MVVVVVVVQRLPCAFSGSLIIRPILALDTPFLLLPFRPSSDPSAARTFVRNYFNQSFDKGAPVSGDELMQELRLTEPMVGHRKSLEGTREDSTWLIILRG